MPTSTHTSTHTVTRPADPFLACSACGARVEWWPDLPGPLTNMPCGHAAGYLNTCPSWSPVNGCCCVEHDVADVACTVPPSPAALALFGR